MTSHTPGPWTVEQEDPTFFRITSDRCGISTVHEPLAEDLGIEQEIAANARLIAAAPELFVALERAATIIANGGRYNGNDIDLIEGAISKARGK